MQFQGFLLTQWITSGILIPVYCLILYKVRHGTQYKFVTNIVWLLLISNVAVIVFSVAFYFGSKVVQSENINLALAYTLITL